MSCAKLKANGKCLDYPSIRCVNVPLKNCIRVKRGLKKFEEVQEQVKKKENKPRKKRGKK